MVKETKFRIIELPERQVLLEKCFNASAKNDCELSVAVIFYVELMDEVEVKITETLGYDSEENRDAKFDSMTVEDVQRIVAQVEKFLAETQNSEDHDD